METHCFQVIRTVQSFLCVNGKEAYATRNYLVWKKLAGASILVAPSTGLVDGQQISYTVTVPSGHGLFAVTAHLCHDPGATPFTSTSFGFAGASGVQCVDSANLSNGGLAECVCS